MSKEMKHFVDHNLGRIIQVAVLIVCFVLLAIGAKREARKADPMYGAHEEYKEVEVNETTENQNPLNVLIESYYNACSGNDIEGLEKIAYPISDMEKSYISFMSQYTEGYEIVKIYQKPGVDPKSFLVSVDVNIKFKDIKDKSPGLDFFYVSTDKNGELYIDNRYSAFNQAYTEEETDSEVQALKEEFENQEDVVMLRLSIQTAYNELVDSNEGFRSFVNEKLPTAIGKWHSDYTAELQKKQAEEEAAKKAEEEAKAQAAAEAEAAAQAEAQAAEAAAQAEAQAAEAAAQAAQAPAAGGYAAGTEITVSDILNIREAPDVNSTKIGAVMKDSTVKVMENSGANGWTKIEHKGKIGYIRTDVLK